MTVKKIIFCNVILFSLYLEALRRSFHRSVELLGQ